MGVRILAVDDNQVNLKVVSATLAHAGYEVVTANSGPQALAIVEQLKPDLVILDITMPDMDGYEVCQRLRSKPATAHLPVMMLTAHDTLEEKIKAFEVGADDYLTKPFQPVELQARIKVLLRRGAMPVEKPPVIETGKLISVFSMRGGVGVSTLATNLSIGLAGLWAKPVALVDLCLSMGQTALFMNVPLRNTWADLARISANELEPELVMNVLLRHDSGVSVLAAPRKAEDGELVTAEAVASVLPILKQRFAYTIIDLPHDLRETTLAALDLSDEILLLMAPEMASVRAAAGALDVFDQLNYSRDKVKIILNWTFERRGLARKDIENVLHQPVQLVVPFSPETFVSAINLGVPPLISAPISPIGSLFEDLAFLFSKEEDRSARPATPSETWLRVNERMEARQQVKK